MTFVEKNYNWNLNRKASVKVKRLIDSILGTNLCEGQIRDETNISFAKSHSYER